MLTLGEAFENPLTSNTPHHPLQIGFNCQYLLDFLSVTQDSSVGFDFRDEQSAGQLRPATEEGGITTVAYRHAHARFEVERDRVDDR